MSSGDATKTAAERWEEAHEKLWLALLAWANGSLGIRRLKDCNRAPVEVAVNSYAAAYLAEAVAPIREYVEKKLPHAVGYDSMHLEEIKRLLGELGHGCEEET